MDVKILRKYSLCYLATPYSNYYYGHEVAFKDAAVIAGRLLKEDVHAFCPIVSTHPVSVYGGLPTDFKFWEDHDVRFMEVCDALVVADMEGWKASEGVAWEIRWFSVKRRPIFVLDIDAWEIEDVWCKD